MNKIIYTIFLSVLICCGLNKQAQAQEIKDKEYILVLSSINFSDMWSSGLLKTLKTEFSKTSPVYEEALMVPTLRNTAEAEQLRDSLTKKYTNPPKLVFLIGDPGWIALKPLFDAQWKDVPTIICHSRKNVPTTLEALLSDNKGMTSLTDKEQATKGYNVTTIEQPFFIKKTIDLMKELIPEMEKIAFIHDNRYISLSARAELDEEVMKNFPNLKLEYLTSPEITSEKLLDTVSRYDSKVGIIYYSWFSPIKDSQEKYLNDHIQRILFGFTNTPVFTITDQNPESDNFAGGYYISVKDVSDKAIEIAHQMLDGERVNKTIVLDDSKATKYLSYHHLQHHNVDPALYPKDAVYFHAPPSPFAKYKVRIVGILSAFIIIILVCVFVAVLYIQKTRQRERQLKLSTQYRKMIENMPMPFLRKELIRDTKGEVTDCKCLDMNPAFEKMADCSRERVIDKKLNDIATQYPNLRIATDKAPVTGYDMCISDKNGNKTYYDQLEFSDKNKDIVETFFINKTDSYRAQLKTEEYHKFLQSILDNLPIATKVNDIHDNLRCIYWNKKAEEMFEASIEDAGKGITKELFTEDFALITQLNNNEWAGIRKFQQKDGKEHSFLVTRHAISSMEGNKWVLSSAIDITEMQENRHTLEYLNNKYQLVLQSTRLIVVSWDIPKQTIFFNAEYSNNNFFSKEDKFTIPDQTYFKNVHPEDLDSVLTMFNQLIKNETDIIELEYRLMDMISGYYKWVNGYATVGDRDNEGKPITIVGAIRDIDEHKLMEVELKRAKEQADESNRLKSAFLANMSHEIRTPLNAIVGFSGILASVDDEAEKQEYINIIENNNRLLLQLIGDILDISKIESGSLEFVCSNVNIYELCNEVYQTANLRIDHTVNVTLSFDEYVPELIVNTERNRLMQVLNNLLTNAIKFTTSGTIKMGYRMKNNSTILFYVSDTGCGIPEDKFESIFGRFVKLNSFVQGTGLGLSICETIIEKLGGKIGVESELGKGSTFWFTIPNIPADQESTHSMEPHPKNTLSNNQEIKILIAEDNDSNYKLFESILKNDYHLVHAWNGLEAVELFKKHNPDLVIMDIKMPVLDGYGATEEIRKLSKTAIIVAATAYAFAEDEQRIYEKGFNGYISKPINAQMLKSKVAGLLSMD